MAAAEQAIEPEHDVVAHRELFEHQGFLEQVAMPACCAARGSGKRVDRAVPEQLAAAFGQDAAEALDQRALAGAVLADQGVDFARRDRQGAIGQRDGLAEIAAQRGGLDERRRAAAGMAAGGSLARRSYPHPDMRLAAVQRDQHDDQCAEADLLRRLSSPRPISSMVSSVMMSIRRGAGIAAASAGDRRAADHDRRHRDEEIGVADPGRRRR